MTGGTTHMRCWRGSALCDRHVTRRCVVAKKEFSVMFEVYASTVVKVKADENAKPEEIRALAEENVDIGLCHQCTDNVETTGVGDLIEILDADGKVHYTQPRNTGPGEGYVEVNRTTAESVNDRRQLRGLNVRKGDLVVVYRKAGEA